MRRITIIVADTRRVGRARCESVLERQDDIVVVSYASEHGEALAAAAELEPRILLCSRRFAWPVNYMFFENLRERCPSTLGVLWADGAIEEDEFLLAVGKGAVGFLQGRHLIKELPEAIRRIDDGEAWVRRRMLGLIRERLIA
jgi:DNA-binding NarL/FixJ family response regulator